MATGAGYPDTSEMSHRPVELRDNLNYALKGVAQAVGGEHSEQQETHPGETGAAPPPEPMDYEFSEKACHGGHGKVGEPSSPERGGPGGNSDEPAICPTCKSVSGDAHVKKGIKFRDYVPGWFKRDKEAPEDRPTLEQSQGDQNRRNEELTRKEDDLKRTEDELKRKEEGLKRKEEGLKRKEEALKKKEGEWKGVMTAMLQKEMKIMHDKQVADLNSELMEYKVSVEKLEGHLSTLEQSKSKSAVGTGAHGDSHATPPNLMRAAFEVTGAALTFTMAFCTFLKEQDAFERHPALQTVPEGEGERYRKYAVESYICSRLFAGFENDSYLDSLEKYEQTPFFLQNQDPELRHQQYVNEYEELQQMSLARVMEWLKTDETPTRCNYFHQFCCRKFDSIMVSLDAWPEKFNLAPATNILHQLATSPMYSDKFLKPFVNLALVAFMLHHLAFQFHPVARIFRFAPGTPFDKVYMQSAVPLDDDEPVEGCIVGLMVIPGFQVGATIVKCIVYLVPSPPVPPACSPA